MIDYHSIMKQLYDVGYEGWVIIEAEQDPKKANPFYYAKMGYNALDDALKAALFGGIGGYAASGGNFFTPKFI